MSCLFLLLHLKLYSHHSATISWFMLVFFQTGIVCQVSPALLLLALDPWLDSQSAGNYLGYSIAKAFFNMTITIIIIKPLYWLMYYLLISNNAHAYTIMLTFIALNVSEDLPAYNFSCVHFSPDNVCIQNFIIWKYEHNILQNSREWQKSILKYINSEAFMATGCK